ncbi:hypothetical protein CK203_023749 [Vitis vinifera]|uniref:Uncharacterized protein n=1 Tax=Vitis vinifera TaxID=29760 RepID=A0A438JAB8_VITVI|nr:hypothetical protein CK203_023749 [Vitis vinifera]
MEGTKKVDLIKRWMKDGFIRTLSEGEDIVQDLLNAFLLGSFGNGDSVQMRDEIRFNNLEDLVVEDCSEINNILSHNVPAKDANPWMRFLPNLKLSLHYMPKLVSSSGGSPFAPKLEWLSVYASKPG